MGWLSLITGLFRPAKELIEVFKPNAEGEAERGHAERLAMSAQDLASLQQFAAEFQPRKNPTWWDSFIDGLNRLPRPAITLGVLAFFVLAPLDPLRFAQIARAYELMPDGFWALLSIIVAFYFGGRMQLKRQDMAIKDGALAVAREVLAVQQAKREHDEATRAPTIPDAEGQPGPTRSLSSGLTRGNRVIESWKRRRLLEAG
jgi:Holin of 3TMs, for gene-transfer release